MRTAGVPIKHRNVVCVYNVMAATGLVWLLERIGLLFLPAPLHAAHLRERGVLWNVFIEVILAAWDNSNMRGRH